MLKFIKNLFKNVLAILLSFFAILLILIGVVSIISTGDSIEVKENSILTLKLDGPILDRSNTTPIDINSVIQNSESAIGLDEILKTIEKAKKDDNIKGIYLDNISSVTASLATTHEIREKLKEFKDSTDKFIISYSEVYDQKGYYFNSVANQIFIHPQGGLDFKGLSYENIFFKNALEKLGVDVQIIRYGKFKSAVEPFLLEKMSPSNREQTNRFITSLWEDIKSAISESRNISLEELDQIAQEYSIQNAQNTVEYNFTDALMYEDQVIDSLKTLCGINKDEKLKKISFSEYALVDVKSEKKKYSKNKIAVVYAQGDIVSGKGEPNQIGSVTTAEAIRNAREDKKVKAIVLRVNSGGGSALASETILREMVLAKEAKPVVVSMGDYAASGGYYIACMADTIVANSSTITGSIGVFGMLLNFKELMNKTLGVTFDTVNTNKFADIGSPSRPLTKAERNIIQNSVNNTYDVFISHVANGRNMTKEKVDEIGQGRVWTGTDALDLGLVDVLGGLEDAIEIAADMADLEHYRIKSLPYLKDPIEQFFSNLGSQTKSKIIQAELGDNFDYINQILKLKDQEKIQARIPYIFEIK